MYWLLGRRFGFSATGGRPIGPGGTKTKAETLSECSAMTPATQGHSEEHLRARKPANQDATRLRPRQLKRIVFFYRGWSRYYEHYHKMSRKYKKMKNGCSYFWYRIFVSHHRSTIFNGFAIASQNKILLTRELVLRNAWSGTLGPNLVPKVAPKSCPNACFATGIIIL